MYAVFGCVLLLYVSGRPYNYYEEVKEGERGQGQIELRYLKRVLRSEVFLRSTSVGNWAKKKKGVMDFYINLIIL